MTFTQRLYRLALLALLGVVLTAGDCFDPDEHLPTAPATLEALQVTLSSATIPADGTSTLTVTGAIDPRAESANRTLVFTTSDGIFLEATATPFRTVERTVEPSGEASVTLRSSHNVGSVEITVQVKDKPEVVFRTSVEFSRADPAGTLGFLALPASVPADLETLTPVTVEIDERLPSGSRTVTFTTNRGTFATATNSAGTTATATAEADQRARVDLKSPLDPGTARLTAAVDGVVVETSLEFVAALPQTILVTPTKVALPATNTDAGTTPVAVRLLRDAGKVSPTTVQARLLEEASGAELAALIRGLVPSNASGETTFTLTAGSLTYRGPAIIEVRVEGASAVGRARIEIVDPPAS